MAQIGKVPDGSEEKRKWKVDMEKYPAMRYGSHLVGALGSEPAQAGWVKTLFLKLGFLGRIGWALKLNAVAVGVG